MRTKPLTPLWLPRTVDPQTSPTTRSSASYWRCTAAGSEALVHSATRQGWSKGSDDAVTS